MDKVFKAIGRFFKKIWEWIKTTPWVQPILIVSIIFGIIFSINPIVNAIKDAVNSDNTGEFYNAHNVQFRDLFKAGAISRNQEPNYGSQYLLNENSGDVLVLYVTDTTLESDVATFYNSEKGQNCTLYVVNLSNEENQRSKWDTSGSWTWKYHYYQYNDAAEYYDYLLDTFVEAYNDNSADSWRNSYAHKFEAEYNYDVFYSGFNDDDTYKVNSTGVSDAKSDVYLSAAVKYHNGQIVDMRFASSGSFTDYGNANKSVTNINVITDLWVGVSENN